MEARGEARFQRGEGKEDEPGEDSGMYQDYLEGS